jgi:hypothetical protein
MGWETGGNASRILFHGCIKQMVIYAGVGMSVMPNLGATPAHLIFIGPKTGIPASLAQTLSQKMFSHIGLDFGVVCIHQTRHSFILPHL